MGPQKIDQIKQSSQKNKKNTAGGIMLPDLKLYYKVILIKKCMLLAQNTHTEISDMEEIGEGDYELQNSNYKISRRDVNIQGIQPSYFNSIVW